MAVLGMLLETVGVLGMASSRVRRVLPANSPISFVSTGVACFFIGVTIAIFGRWLQ